MTGRAALRGRDYIETLDWTTEEIDEALGLASELKEKFHRGETHRLLPDRTLFMLFLDKSTRTRNAFEAGMTQLGGHAHFLDAEKTQIAHGESPKDMGIILSRYGHGLAIRHDLVPYEGNAYMREVAKWADIPLINLQCDVDHPTQTLADLMTMREQRGRDLRGLRVAVSWAFAPSYAKPLSVPQGLLMLLPRFGIDVVLAHPPGFDLMDNRTEIWLPIGVHPVIRRLRENHVLQVIGRLKDGVTPQAAETELATFLDNWGERVGVQGGHVPTARSSRPEDHTLRLQPLQEAILGDAPRVIWVLQTAAGLVLLIACANLASLVLARAESRRREFAVRAALGASRGRLIQQTVTEGALLSVAGGAIGLWVARMGLRSLVLAYPTSLPRTSELTIDLPVLLAAKQIAGSAQFQIERGYLKARA